VEEQVCVIYAGTRGYLDKVAVGDVRKYEKELLTHLKTDHSAVLADIASGKKLTDDIEGRLKSVLETFTNNFVG